jgi:predicted NBD/HSP70 family sugar kinase
MSLNVQPVLGIAMGTSQAVGYVDEKGHITGWLNELAFAPVDYADDAPVDHEWSGDKGTGVQYFSQDAVIRLAPKAGIELDPKLSPGDKLKKVQDLLKAGDKRALPIFESIGIYLGYALAQYAEFYNLQNVLILGRVTSGEGGTIILENAQRVIKAEAAHLSDKIKINLPDEASRRVGQAIAAASLPALAKV